ncbi:hypothetical protein GCM10025771_29170 [Niveibacterium umoris]|uniref:Radical SAM protein with 4Fe4S-binding SPASM domain n=1 Tax=Niveibacterium umoris TaxID=1193620 RepID=A0A840BFU3_9RHOO|nr:radical SAM protein [Niveibacterium umoris]MBB4011890.1 radical SAM protein with 4Fe4S-binding SPASM domain [Niveibacterium umoris]
MTLASPEVLDIEPIHTCNLRCKMCHVSTETLTNERIDIDQLERSLDGWEGGWAYVGSTHEPMAHPEFPKLIEVLARKRARIVLTTNATLAKPAALEALRGADVRRLYISFDGVTPSVYESVRRGASFDKALEGAMRLIDACRDAIIAVNYTVMASTLADTRAAAAFWEARGVHGVGFIVAVRRSNHPDAISEVLAGRQAEVTSAMEDVAEDIIRNGRAIFASSPVFSESWFLERYAGYCDPPVVFSHTGGKRPLNARTEILTAPHPEMPIACSAPFRGAKIRYSGEVVVCDRVVIGNIHDAPLLEIWRSPAAESVRATVPRPGNELCASCDYYRFCLRAASINLKDESAYTSERVRRSA